MENKSICILTDLGYKHGLGHYIRCNEIKKRLLKSKISIDLYVISQIENFEKIKRYDLYILDLPYDMTNYIEKYQNMGSKVLTLEYFDTKSVPDLNISVMEFPKFMNQKGYNLRSGFQYIIIREEIRLLKCLDESETKYCLIMLGGSASQDLILNIISKIKNPSMKLKIIHPFCDELSFNETIKNVQIIGNTSTIPKLMAKSSFCITSGGITMLEMIYLKKIIYSYPNNDKENLLAEIMKQRNLISGLNLKSIDFNDLSKTKMAENDVFLGEGSKEIEEEIKNLVLNG
tara:strand:+ start:1039 stop:1902 length:864 start_codon:yes stop_codon:yes gene_type:complete